MFKVFVFRCVAHRWLNKCTQKTRSEGLGMFKVFLFRCVVRRWLNNFTKKTWSEGLGMFKVLFLMWLAHGWLKTFIRKRGRKDQGCSKYFCIGVWCAAGRRGRCCAAPGAPCGSGARPPRLSGIKIQFHISIIGGVQRHGTLPPCDYMQGKYDAATVHVGAEHFGNTHCSVQ